MGNAGGGLVCARCGWVNALGARYCAHCGEPVDPAVVAELQRLYTLLTELDMQVAAGLGNASVQSLRDTIRARYLAQRAPQPGAAAIGAPAPATVPLSQPAAAGVAAPASPVAPVAPTPAPTPARAAAVVAAPQPHGPVFSWRAFIAEQAIAVMAYLGGFLLLIATLTFEVGGWQALPDGVKLAGVVAVYILFGALGAALRRSTSLRTVGRVYLGVFALMTPLAALAVYRFELQARGFPISGTICLAAAYAAVVYISLAARTRFVTYAYLGWAALLLAALAIPPWAGLIVSWWIPVINLVALALLALHFWRRRTPASAALETLEPSATQFSAGAGMLGIVATIALSMQVAGGAFTSGASDEGRAAFALAACALTALLAAWGRAAPHARFFADAQIIGGIDWATAASAPLAAVAVAVWLHASLGGVSYTLTGVALAEGMAAEALRRRAPAREGLRIGVQILAAALVVVAAILTNQEPLPNAPLLLASAAAVALGLAFALRGGRRAAFPWGAFAGVFLLIGAGAAFNAAIPADLLSARGDRFPDALTQFPSLFALLALALSALGLGLRRLPVVSQARRLRSPTQVTALLGAIIASISLTGGHTRIYSAVILCAFALLALAVTRIERQPFLGGACAAIFGAVGALVFVITNHDGAAVVALPIALAILTVIAGRWMGRGYSAAIYVATLFATFFGFLQLATDPAETTAGLALLGLGIGGWMTLTVALALVVDALTTPPSPADWLAPVTPQPVAPLPLEGPITPTAPGVPVNRVHRAQPAQPSVDMAPIWMLAPAGAALLSVVDARALWPVVALTLALAGAGALLRRLRGAYWEPAWHGAALVASLVALIHAMRDDQHAAILTLSLALLFALVAYLIAWQERLPWLSLAIAPYALVALGMADALPLSANQILAATFAIALGLTLGGMAARLWLGRAWALAPYGVAVVGAYLTAARVEPYPAAAGLLEAILLIFAALAFVAALLERSPWAALAPAIFAIAAAVVQPDGHALLPLALAFAAASFAVSRTRGGAWALPLYGATLITAITAAWQARNAAGGFEVVALVALALAAWLLAALESRPDALLVTYTFAALAVSAAARAFGWEAWQATLAFAALAWIFDLSRLGWARIPWLRERETFWLPGLGGASAAERAAWSDPRRAGQRIARGAAALLAVGAVVGGWFAPQSFATQTPQTQAVSVALLSLAALLAAFGWGARGWRPALYLAGEALALFVSWELRWLGADNLQAWIIAPGSAQLIIGALLPADERLRPPAWAAQTFSIAGALILTLPTLGQSITEPTDWQWRYALLLAVEALALTLLAVGLRNRILALTGSAFVGVAAIRGAIIAVQQNLPVPIVIAVFALALMGLATWLSLSARRAARAPTTPTAP